MNRLHFYSLLVVTLLLFTHNFSHAQGKNMTHLLSKPYFTLKVDAYGTIFIVQVNGVAVYRDYDADGQVSTYLPVNHWMTSGENSISLMVAPESPGGKYSHSAHIEIALQVTSNEDKEHPITIATLKFNGKNDLNSYTNESSPSGRVDLLTGQLVEHGGDVVIGDITTNPIPEYDGANKFERKLDIPSSIPKWAFFDSDNIPDIDRMSDEEYYKFMGTLLAEYTKVQYAIQSGKIDAVMPLFSERNKELDAAFYYAPGTMEKKLRSSLTEAANDPGLELLELNKDYVDFTKEDIQ